MTKVHISLLPSQRSDILELMYRTTNKYEALRCRIILLLDGRQSVNEVAMLAGCARATVYRTIYRFEDHGLAGLVDGRRERVPLKVTAEVVRHLMAYVDMSPKDYGWQRCEWTLELFAAQLRLDTHVELSVSQVWRVLRQEGNFIPCGLTPGGAHQLRIAFGFYLSRVALGGLESHLLRETLQPIASIGGDAVFQFGRLGALQIPAFAEFLDARVLTRPLLTQSGDPFIQ